MSGMLATQFFFPGIGIINATGSFRGARFRLDSYETAGGRRAQVSEYPLRDEPGIEDLGRKARRFRFTAYVLGPGWEFERDALLNACERKPDPEDPGLLVHPFHGEHMVVCLSYSVSESRSGGQRYAAFELEFVEAGSLRTPSYQADPGYSTLEDVKFGRGVMERAF